MREVLTVTSRGRATWASVEHKIELATLTTTRWDASGERSDTTVGWDVRFDAPEIGLRRFSTEHERDAFVLDSLSRVELEPVSPLVAVEIDHVLSAAVGQRLAILDFVWDYLQLRFEDGEGPSPLNLYVMPRVRTDSAVFRNGDAGYADRLVALIGTPLVAVDEVLDLGLVLAFANDVRLTVPLDGTDATGPEVAECTASESRGSMVWRPGDEPIEWLTEEA